MQMQNLYHRDFQLLLAKHQVHPWSLATCISCTISAALVPSAIVVVHAIATASPVLLTSRPHLTPALVLQGKNPPVAEYFITPKEPERSLLSLISSQPARTLAEMAQQAQPEQELTCWAALAAGSGSLQTTSQRVRTLPFRCAAWWLEMGSLLVSGLHRSASGF